MGERMLVVEADLRYEPMTHAMHTSGSKGKPSRSHARMRLPPPCSSLSPDDADEGPEPTEPVAITWGGRVLSDRRACRTWTGSGSRGSARTRGGAHPQQQSQHRRRRTVQRLKKTGDM
jgi:hypothetical protein